MLVAGRTLLSLPWPDTTTGSYYWQHCWYVDTDDWGSDLAMAHDIGVDMQLLYTSQVSIYGLSFYYPGTNTVYFRQTYLTPGHGGQAAVTNPNILICARWRMFGDDGSYSYHLHRQPIGDSYLESGQWSTLGFTQQSLRLSTFKSQGIYRTQTGALIDSGYVSADPVPWQLRHGTKRRNYRGWL